MARMKNLHHETHTETRRYDASVRISEDVLVKARKVAVLRGLRLPEYISTTLESAVDSHFEHEIRNLTAGGSSRPA